MSIIQTLDYMRQKEEQSSYSLSLQIKNSLGYYNILLNSSCKIFLWVFFPPCLLFQQVHIKCAQFTRKQKNPVLPVSATGSSYASEIHWILSLSDHRLQGFCRINLCLVYIAQQYCLQVLLTVCVHNMELHPAHLLSLSLLCCF